MPSDHLPGAVRLFGLDILPLSFEQSADLLLHAAATKGPKVVVTTNVDHVVRLERDPELKALYASADYTFADGMLYPGDVPGHGVEIDEALAAKYPYRRAYLPVNRQQHDGTLWHW